MKMNVKLWLLASLLMGWIPAVILIPVLLVMFELPPAIAISAGILVALLTGLVVQLDNLRKWKQGEKQNQERRRQQEIEQAAQDRKDFCKDCRNFKIFSENDLRSPEKKQRFQLIAKKHHLEHLDQKELLAILEEGKQEYAVEQQKKEEARQQELEKKRAEERHQQVELSQYARYHGTDKTQVMLSHELLLLKNRISETMMTPPAMIPKQKESDGMLAAGTAYGLGGILPAAASLARTGEKNARIRQTNAQIDQINSALIQSAALSNADSAAIAKRMESFKDRASTLLLDEDGDKVFSHLHFADPQVEVSETGTVTVRVKVTADEGLKVFGKPAIADGSVKAEIFCKGEKVGQAILVFPVFGTGNLLYRQKVYHWQEKDETVELTGMCLSTDGKRGRHTVEFAPADLWAMEK